MFALSPLVLIWSRTAVSDGLLCALLSLSLLLQWRRFANPDHQRWFSAWFVLGLAVLAKGPVAVVLSGLTLLLFGLLRQQLGLLWQRLRPLPGLLITALISLPWYTAELLVEGQPFWDSFFGYHNLQRFTSVVNDHLQPWWFFLPVMAVAAIPFTAYLLVAFVQRASRRTEPQHSLQQYAACWLLAVFLFFTTAATKLPSYWLPATPAAALLITLALRRRTRAVTLARGCTLLGSWSVSGSGSRACGFRPFAIRRCRALPWIFSAVVWSTGRPSVFLLPTDWPPHLEGERCRGCWRCSPLLLFHLSTRADCSLRSTAPTTCRGVLECLSINVPEPSNDRSDEAVASFLYQSGDRLRGRSD